jgi:hypothetical protein
MASKIKLIPIYTTRGELGAFLLYPYIFSRSGDWIGWVTVDRMVYSVHGYYVGILSKDPRILRKRELTADLHPFQQPPPPPAPIIPPARVPLAPQMSEIAVNMIDVLEDAPELLPPTDFGEHRKDLD